MSNNGSKIELPSSIVIRDLAQKIEKSPIDLIKKLMSNGVMATINQAVDFDTAAIVVAEYGFEAVPEIVEEVVVETGEVPLWRRMIAGEVIVMLRQSPRTFVESVDFVSSVGFGRDGTGRRGHRGAGPTVVITDLGVLEPDPADHELTLTAVHPGISVDDVRAATGWPLRVTGTVAVTSPPSAEELQVLRDLKERTAVAHRGG